MSAAEWRNGKRSGFRVASRGHNSTPVKHIKLNVRLSPSLSIRQFHRIERRPATRPRYRFMSGSALFDGLIAQCRARALTNDEAA